MPHPALLPSKLQCLPARLDLGSMQHNYSRGHPLFRHWHGTQQHQNCYVSALETAHQQGNTSVPAQCSGQQKLAQRWLQFPKPGEELPWGGKGHLRCVCTSRML